MSRVVVLGGGVAGTATAARLAKQRHDVTLVERRDRLGGALGLVESAGFRWDAGPATTALPAVLRDLFRKSGRPLERELDLVPGQPIREHRFPDGTVLRLTSGTRSGQLEAVEAACGPGTGEQWVDYVHGFAGTWDVLRRSALERPWSPEHVDRASAAVVRTRDSLRRLVHRSLTDPRLREVALAPTLLDGQDPRRVPSWTGMSVYLEQSFGVWTVPGGLGALAEVLTRRLAERRVAVLLETTATDLRVHGGRVVGVETDRGPVDAEIVVCAMDPRALPALARRSGRRPARTVPPPAVVHLGLGPNAPDLPHEVLLHRPGTSPLVVRTGGAAPPGAAAWTVLARPGRRAGPDEDVLTTLARFGIDVRHQVEVRVDRSPQQQVRELGGSPYGTRWRGRSGTDARLGRPDLVGVHLAGVHAAGGSALPYVGLTAAVVAQLVGPA